MLDMMGDEYIVQHIQQCYMQEMRRKTVLYYFADCLYVAANTFAEKGKLPIEKRLVDIMEKPHIHEEKRSAEEIKRSILAGLRGD